MVLFNTRSWPLFLVSWAAIFTFTNAAPAAMSIDLGSQSLKIGLVKPGVPLEIVLNKDSRRKTPFCVGIKNGERFFGDAALQFSLKNPANTFSSFLDLLGKKIDNPIVQKYKDEYPFADLVADERRGTVVFKSSEGNFAVETLMAMILWNAREQCGAFAGQSIKDVVITIPAYFGQAERKALQDAAAIAGLNLLQLMTDGSAAALSYGVFRRKAITEQEQTLLIYDVGHVKTTATLVGYRLVKEKGAGEAHPVLSILGVGYDRVLGGSTLTRRLRDHLLEQFIRNGKPKGDIRQSARAMAKLNKEAERVKQVLSANADHYAQVEGLFEEKDFRLKVTRDEFLQLFADLEPRFVRPALDALKMAEMTPDKVEQVVLMGAGTRVPRLQQLLKDAFNGRELGRFLNTDEAAAMGSLYQAAHLSQGFKVLRFDIQELQLFPVQVQFTSGNAAAGVEPNVINRILYGYKSAYPAPRKVISFTSHTDDFDFRLNYATLTHFTDEQLQYVGAHNITAVNVRGVGAALKTELSDENATFKGVKVHFRLDNVGVVKAERAELIVERVEPASNSTLSRIVDKIGEYFKEEQDPGKIEEEQNVGEKKSDERAGDSDNADEFGDSPKADDETDGQKTTSDAANTSRNANEKKAADDDANASWKAADEAPKARDDEQTTTTEKRDNANAAQHKPKVVKVALTMESTGVFYEMNADEVEAAAAILVGFETKEREKAERDAAHNALEAAVYDVADKLDEDEFRRFATDDELSAMRTSVSELKTWLEDDVSPLTAKHEFDARKKELDALVKKARFRRRQNEERDKYVSNLEKALSNESIASFRSLTAVFTEVELGTLEKLVAETGEWLTTKKAEQSKLADNQDPAFTIAELKEKASALEREVKYLANKMYAAKLKAEQEKLEKIRQEAAAKANEAFADKANNNRDAGESAETAADTSESTANATTPTPAPDLDADAQQQQEQKADEKKKPTDEL